MKATKIFRVLLFSKSIKLTFFILLLFCNKPVFSVAPQLREQISLNGTWLCDSKNVEIPEYFGTAFKDTRRYSRRVTVPVGWKNKIIQLRFASVVHKAVVFINGKKITEHYGGFAPFEMNLTDLVTPGKAFLLAVDVTGSNAMLGKDGKVLWPVGGWIKEAGISDDVCLRAYGKTAIADAFIKTSVKEKKITIDYTIINYEHKPNQITIECAISKPGSANALKFSRRIALKANETKLISIATAWDNAELYWPDKPVLYHLVSQINVEAKKIDEETRRFGFREVSVHGNQIYWNGVRCNLYGSYETFGDDYYGITREVHSKEAFPATADKMLAMNIRCVRWHHNPVPGYLLDICDEKGLLVCSESPNYARDFHKGMSPEGIESYIQNYIDWCPAWIKEERNHPSIYIFNVTNEKTHNFCEQLTGDQCRRMGAPMRKLDPTRLIGYDGDKRASEELFNYHYPEKYNEQPKGSIYSWASLVMPNQPTGAGEVLHAKRPEKSPDIEKYNCERNKWWMGIWLRGLRYTNWTDVRPACFWFAGTDLENCDPLMRVRGVNLKNAYAPIALFDKNYDDLGISPYVFNLTPGGTLPEITAGSSQQRTLIIYNDEFDNTNVSMTVSLRVNGKVIEQVAKDVQVPLGSHFDIPYSFKVPKTLGKPLEIVLSTSKAGVKRFEEIRRFNVVDSAENEVIANLKIGSLQKSDY